MSSSHYSREQIVEMFKRFAEQGIANPDDLINSNDPDVQAADAALDAWYADLPKETPAQLLETALSRSTIHVDAGFRDRDYLSELANDWLAQDEQSAQNAGLLELAVRISAKRDEINALPA